MRRRAPCVRVYALENCAWARYTTRYICAQKFERMVENIICIYPMCLTIISTTRRSFPYFHIIFYVSLEDRLYKSSMHLYPIILELKNWLFEIFSYLNENYPFRNYFRKQMLKYIFKEEKKRFTRKIHGIIPRRKGNIYFYFMKKKIYFLQPWCWSKTLQDTLVTCVGQRQTWNVFS